MKRILFTLLFTIIVISLYSYKYSLEVQWLPQAQFAGYIMAVEKGFYEEAGIDLELNFYSGDKTPLKKLEEGKIDFCSAWLSQATKDNNGNIVNISQILQKSSLMIIAKKEIKKPEDLNGKKISLWKGDFSVQLTAFLNKFDIQYKEIPGSYNIELFLSGACDAASVMYYNEYNKIYLAGIDKDDITAFFFSDYKEVNFPEDGLYCRKEFFQKNESICKKFTKATIKGWNYAFQNKEETLTTILRYCNNFKLRTNKAQQRWMLNKIQNATNYKPNSFNWDKLSKKDYLRVAKELKKQNFIEKIIPFEEFYKGSEK